MVNWVTMEAVKEKPLSFINTNGLQNKKAQQPSTRHTHCSV